MKATILFVVWILGGLFKSCIESRPVSQAQKPAGRFSFQMEKIWADQALQVVRALGTHRDILFHSLLKEKQTLGSAVELLDPDQPETRIQGTYGKLPEVHLNSPNAAVFPQPLTNPERFSSFQIWIKGALLGKGYSQLESQLNRWKELPHEVRNKTFEGLVDAFILLNRDYLSLVLMARYLKEWLPPLIHTPNQETMIKAIFQSNPDAQARLSEALRPKRWLKRSFLPDQLSLGQNKVLIPIATDISDKHFLSEVEGALIIHWNQSSWAKAHRTEFKIQWGFLPKNLKFSQKKIDLQAHLKSFPKNKAGLTTGGLTTFVKDQILVLGPGQITPRTLAHELGHLLGFNDCYFRTLSGQGFFGISILEWNNPLYPDDIMCDNLVGEPRVEVW